MSNTEEIFFTQLHLLGLLRGHKEAGSVCPVARGLHEPAQSGESEEYIIFTYICEKNVL